LSKKSTDIRTWRVVFDVSREVIVEASSAAEAEQDARDNVLFADEFPIDHEEITDTSVLWVDKMDVGHTEACSGTHCKHYDCREEGDDVPWYCTQCDPECQ
jgi:hypothetical protein